MCWPHAEKEKETPSGEVRTVTAPLSDMKDALKQQAHAHAKYGNASTEGVYAKSWSEASHKIHHPASHLFMTSTKVGARTRQRVLQYRWGLLPTQRYLKKIGKSDHLNCPLCGQEDGGHHAVSGCSALRQAYIRRHNDAGTEILEAINRGTQGAHILLSDVGFTKRRSSAEVPANMQPHRFMRHMDPPRYLSQSLVDALTEQTSVPDIILVESQDTSWYFTLVEIKYCRDTDPEPQRDRAAEQHAELVAMIKEHEPDAIVKLVTVTLGASGAIYENFLQDMKQFLGVDGPALKSLARRLHFIAVNNLEQIWAQRTVMIHGDGHKQKGRKQKRTKPLKHMGRGNPHKHPRKQSGVKRAHPTGGAPEHRKRSRKR
jgi:hypothetical protein